MAGEGERLEASVRGAVQGVGYRWFTRRQAERLGLVGWVANESDGSVRLVAEGDPDRLALLEAALRSGPAGAQVERVEVARQRARGGFARFEIRSGAHPGD